MALSPDHIVEVSERSGKDRIAFLDMMLVPAEHREEHFLRSLEHIVIKDKLTAVLIRESDGILEFTVGCLGYLVGHVRLPMNGPLRPAEQWGAGLRLVVTPDRLRRELIPASHLPPVAPIA
jgi:hypothetical protein